ncbi:MAG: cytochrome c oxidase assembly protein [Caulobacteraceae bacterium]|nr:cytochrome c oxidase assembly protein [Caulobacteraceae bacterium]
MRALSACLIGAAVTLTAGRVAAHASASEAPGWTLDPAILLPLLLSGCAFAVGWLRLFARSAHNRAGLIRRGLCFALGWLTLAGALVSPLHQAGEQSFAVHMIEHELLMLAAAPLLVMSQPLVVMLWAFRSAARRGLGRISAASAVRSAWRGLTNPVTATLLQASALWLWHMPSLFDMALGSPVIHAAQHASFLLSALLFWSAMLHPHGLFGRGLTVLCLFATSVVSGALGAAMAFSESPWYAPYARLPITRLGLSPAEDQQLAGLLMWVPGGLVHAGAALAFTAAALRQSARVPLATSRTTLDAV